jgi:hypothetical protein
MTTGAQFVKFYNKALLGFGDWGTRLSEYLRTLSRDVVKAHWDVDGVFNVALTLTGPGANTVQVTGSSRATDGSGHIFDMATAFTRNAVFQNTNTVPYYVGLYYAEVPDDVRISPRTGLPQYIGWKEHVGKAGTPNSVINNGNGTMTFIVDSVTESGVTNAGRSVLVYKIVPAPNALTTAIAVETLTVAWDGTNNKITTVGLFGQSGSPSLTNGDYVVVLLGPSVSRNTDLRVAADVCFIGIVTGNGGTPSAFNIADQRILKTFQDATQIVYTPHNWIAATNVGAALDEIADDLSSNNATTPGALIIGIDPTDFDSQLYSNPPEFGLGIVESGGFASNAKVEDALVQIEKILKRRLNSHTMSDGSFPADSESVALGDQIKLDGRIVLLRKLANQTTTPYTLTGDMDERVFRVVSESTDYGDSTNPWSRKTRVLVSGTDRILAGRWQSVWLDCSGADFWKFPWTGGNSFVNLQDFEVTGGHVLIESTGNDQLQSVIWRDGMVKAKSEATVGKAYSLHLQRNVSSAALRGVFQDMVVYGPHSSQTTPAPLGALIVDYDGGNFANGASAPTLPSRPLVFERCVFIQQRTGVGLINAAGKQKVVFRDCFFIGMSASTANLVTVGTGAQAHFDGCTFFDPEGVGTFTATGGANVTATDCDFVVGVGGTNSAADPKIIRVHGSNMGAMFTNNRVYLGDGVTRDSGSTSPLLDFGNQTGEVGVHGLRVYVIKNGSNSRLHLTGIIRFNGGGAVGRVDATDVLLNLDAGRFPPGATTSMVAITQANVRGLRLVNWSYPDSGVTAGGILLNTLAFLSDVSIERPVTGGGSSIGYLLRITGNSTAENVQIHGSTNFNVSAGVIGDGGSGPSTVRTVRLSSSADFTSGVFLNFTGELAAIHDVQMDTTQNIVVCSTSGRDSQVTDCVFKNSSTGGNMILLQGRRQKFQGNTIHWNGTTNVAIALSGNDSLIHGNLAYRSAGAQAMTSDTGTGNVSADNILSTTL